MPAVTVSAGPGLSVFGGSSVTLQGSGSAGTYLWTPATGLSATNILNPVATPAVTTTYTLRITNQQGCSNTSNVTIDVLPYCVKPLNAFTPNNDGFNDTWFITNGNCLKKAMVAVYNRYGSKVFESGDYKNDWNGTYKNKPLPDATYYYVIDYELLNDTHVFKKGNVTILR
ncbi:MAG: gliding motility-associated C-terminal domain-containing protein [Chitinophagaceae bacterium]|nr:gliding motility-associated C-terminal domain-containing protein [Chitinophagaceae bacterium]